jgi:hypothetical protein
MAYNPFNIFRRHQKIIFAVLTVFIMLMFTLSSGLGGGADFFDWLPQWLGRKAGKKGDQVCTIEGSKVYRGQLDDLNYQRVMANRFMSLAAGETYGVLDAYIREQSTRLSADARQIMQQVNQQEQLLPFFARDPQFASQLPMFIEELKNTVASIITLPTAKSEDKDIARAKYAALSLMFVAGGEHFFGNVPNRGNRDLIEFMLWQKKADQLGIQFTTDDIGTLIQSEFYGFFRSDVPIRKHLQQNMAGFSMERCLAAIGEEFRVRMAQVAVLGPPYHGGRSDKTYGGFPAFNTSYEIFNFYREETSPTTYAAVPVPALNFIDKVVGEPTEDELNRLYLQYKNDEYNPGRESPGFREPRKTQLAFLGVTGAEPYYTKLAEEKLQAGELHAKIGSMLTVPVLGISPAWLVGAAAPNAAKEPLVYKAYETIAQQHRLTLFERYQSPDVTLANSFSLNTLLPASIVRPGNMAAAAGGMGGQLLAFGNPMSAAAVLANGPIAYEIRDRVQGRHAPATSGRSPAPALFDYPHGRRGRDHRSSGASESRSPSRRSSQT